MNKISIIKKIQLGESSFSIEHPFSKLDFSFYCGESSIKHQLILSIETSNLMDSLLESGQINETDLIEHHVPQLKKIEYQKGPFSYRYQTLNPVNCNNTYLIIFDMYEYRDYCSCIVNAVFQIESKIKINDDQKN